MESRSKCKQAPVLRYSARIGVGKGLEPGEWCAMPNFSWVDLAWERRYTYFGGGDYLEGSLLGPTCSRIGLALCGTPSGRASPKD